MTKIERIEKVERAYLRAYLASGEVYLAPYYCVATEFHGGGMISKHLTLRGAARAVVDGQDTTDCICGCARILDSAEYAKHNARLGRN